MPSLIGENIYDVIQLQHINFMFVAASNFLRPSVPSISTTVRNKYIYVNDKEPEMDWNSLTERAAAAMFWTEIVRGETMDHFYVRSKMYVYRIQSKGSRL